MKVDSIIWDFDGVLIDSNLIRRNSFKSVLGFLSNKDLDEFLIYHELNGGLSRYHKLDWLQSKLEYTIDRSLILNNFSSICLEQILKERPLINRNIDLIKNNQNIHHYIASGSDQNELRLICENLNIDLYFKGIFGSPIPKNEIVKDILTKLGEGNTVLIGDSLNDLEAARANQITFVSYNMDTINIDYTKHKPYSWFLKNF